MESIPNKYFDRITKDPNPAAFLAGIPNEELFAKEDTHLEFKAGAAWNNTLKADGREAALGRMKAIFSRALGAFANAGGGVLVFGLTAQGGKDPETRIQKDRVWDTNLVQRPEELKEKLYSWLLNATDPPLAGVVIEHYVSNEAKNEGFVVCYVPQGSQRPYRSEFDGPNYYTRYTGGADVILPSHLRLLFAPQRILKASITITPFKVPERDFIGLSITCKNEGKYSFERAFLRATIDGDTFNQKEFGNFDGIKNGVIVEKWSIHPTIGITRRLMVPIADTNRVWEFSLYAMDSLPLVHTANGFSPFHESYFPLVLKQD